MTAADLRMLTENDAAPTQVSLFMPTHRSGAEQADRLRWKNLLTGVEAMLEERMPRADIDELLAPAWALHQDAMAWQYMDEGLAMFIRPGWHREFRIAAPVPELATIGERLVMGPLARLLAGDEDFVLVALSQRDLRVLECSRNEVSELDVPALPTALREVVAPQEPRSDTMARPTSPGTRNGPAVFYGHGAGDEHFKKDEVQRYMREVASALREALAEHSCPVVLVGLEHLVAAYREANGLGNVLEEAVIRNTDGLSAEELQRLAWPVIEGRLRDRRTLGMERFRELHGTGKVSSDLQTVNEAALHGRIDTLFIQADPWCWERAAAGSPAIVQLGADARYAECEQVDAAALATLDNGGQVYATSETVVPGSEVAAVFRY